MKKIIILLAVFTLLVAGIAYAGISGSKHDMRTQLTGEDLGYAQICIYCHTPHNAAVVSLPLWNKSITSGATYVPYNNPNGTMDAADVNATFGPQSNACLTCHDGTLAITAILRNKTGGVSGTNLANLDATFQIISTANFGSDLSNDHPIGFTYVNTGGNELVALASVQAYNPASEPILFGSPKNQVECASCHKVHDPSNAPFLRTSNAGSALCLKCHVK